MLSEQIAESADQHERQLVLDASRDAKPTAGIRATDRLRSIAKVAIIYIAVPLLVYNLLRSAGMTAVTALVLSGVFPAFGVVIGFIRHRRLEVVGALVLAGIIVGTVLGLISHSTRPVLMEGSVPTAVFGVACLGSLWTRRPLMFSMALEFMGPDTAKGREMTELWQGEGEYHEGYRRVIRTITAVWGVGFLLEAALRVVIVLNTSPGTALSISNVTPFVWAGALSVWTITYGAYRKKQGERYAATVAARSAEITSTADKT